MQAEGDALPAEDEEDIDGADMRGNFTFALAPHIDVALIRRGPDLVVGFGRRGEFDPIAAAAEETGWSFLGIAADWPKHLRSAPVTAFFDALVHGTLLDEFDSVTFVGGGACADAAMGYALAAPGARIVALGLPDRPTGAGRYPVKREVLAAASAGYLVHDPRDAPATAAARSLKGRGIITLPLRIGASDPLEALTELGALGEVLSEAMAGMLDPAAFFRILRARRGHDPYLRGLAERLAAEGRDLRAAIVMRNAGTRLGRGRYLRRFREIEERLAHRGIAVPPARG